MKKLTKLLVLMLCLALVVTTMGAAAPVSSKDTLTIAVQEDMADKDPINGSTTNNTVKIKSQVYETLIERTVPDSEYKGLLAESWEWSEDFLELTVTLKKGIMCHNGEELKASDCVFSLQKISESSNNSNTEHMDLEKTHVVDDYTFVIVMDEVYMPVISNLSYPTCVMFSQKGYEEADGDWANMDIGTGAYAWGDWVMGDHVDLVGVDDYHIEGQPAIKNVSFKVIPEDGNRYIEVETGGADMAYNVSGVDIPAAEANPDLTLFREYTNDNAYLSFNMRKEPFNDVRVRKAIAMAMDLESAWSVCMDGVGRPAIGLLPDNIVDSISKADSPYHVDYPMYEYNIEAAKELLAEAGYPDGFSCQYHVGNMAVRMAYGEFFKNAFSQIGIDVEIVSLDGATNNQALKVEHNFDIYTWGIAATNGDIDYANRYFWSKDNTNRNIMGYNNPEMDELIEAAAKETDTEKRSELNAEIQKLALEDVAMVPIYQQEDIFCFVNSLQGFRNGAFQSPLLRYCYFE